MTTKDPRARIWPIIRDLHRHRRGGAFSARDIRGELKGGSMHPSTIRAYLYDLCDAAILRREEGSPGAFRLVADPGIEPPRVRPGGAQSGPHARRAQLWRAAKVLGRGFSARQLAIAATTEEVPVGERVAADFCRALEAAGYLYVLSRRNPRIWAAVPGRIAGPVPPSPEDLRAQGDAR